MENPNKPTVAECLEAVKAINKDVPQSEELLLHKAHILYFVNRISFWDDIPILFKIIDFERKSFVSEKEKLFDEMMENMDLEEVECEVEGEFYNRSEYTLYADIDSDLDKKIQKYLYKENRNEP